MISLKEYQSEATSKLERSLNNALVIAPTGSGKTIIAAAYAEKFYNKENKILFLTPTNILRDQQLLSFSKNTTIPVHTLGAGLTDTSKPGCYFSTGHFVQTLIQKNNSFLKLVDLILVDEAHKSWLITSPYAKVSAQVSGRIIGFTATPGGKTQYECIKTNLRIKDVIIVHPPKDVETTIVNTPLEFSEEQSLFLKNTYERLLKTSSAKAIEKLQNISFDPFFNKPDMSNKVYLKLMKTYKNLAYSYLTARKYLFEIYKTVYHHPECSDWSFLSKKGFARTMFTQDNPKFKKIIELIGEMASDAKALIFFEYHSAAEEFVKYAATKDYVCARLYGKTKQTSKERTQNLTLLKAASTRIVVATSVAEEGISIQGIDLVIFHSPITNPIRRIQRIGRTGRYRNGAVHILYYLRSHEAQTIVIGLRRANLAKF